MVESVDTPDLKSCGRKAVRVQLPPKVLVFKISHVVRYAVFHVCMVMKSRKSPNVSRRHRPYSGAYGAGTAYGGSRKSRRRKKSTLRRVGETLAILACVLLVVGGGLWYYIAYAPAISKETVLYVPSKASYRQVCDSLRAAGFVNDYRFDLLAKIRKYPYYVKPGRYILTEGASTSKIVDKLRSGAQDEVHLHFGRMRSLPALASKVGRQIEADSAALMAFFSNPVRLGAFNLLGAPLTYETALGCFIPNTYYIHWNTTPEKFLSRMIYEQENFWNDTRRAQAGALKLTPLEVITLASIVELETNKNDEKADIASVYLNRLRRGIPLQADPTVKYALGDPTLRRILKVHLKTDSPYNTYLYRGLPPGPICTPSAASIDAVLADKKTSYLYFCAREDFSGYHAFASNLSAHNANARRYHRALNERKIR